METFTKIHLVTMDTETAKEECSMHYALLLYSRLRKKYNKQYI